MRGPAIKDFWKHFGPGLLFAGAAVGVSHLVQSTRAGAVAGFGLAGVILLALVLKYPFFEFGPRYAAATGQSLIEGYRGIGRWAVWLYFLLTGTSGVIVQVAVTMFTAFLLQYVIGTTQPLWLITTVLLAACISLLRVGRYRALDFAIKVVMVLLTVTTLVAASTALPKADLSTFRLVPMEMGQLIVPLGFILALAGWMPTAIDLNVWSSLWTLAKNDESGTAASVRQARLDFQIGYVSTGILALAFLVLGAVVMHGSGRTFDPRGTVFATQLIDLYTESLGAWVRPIVLTSALATMFSTTLTVVDGVPRAMDRALTVLTQEGGQPTGQATATTGRFYWPLMLTVGVITILVVWLFIGSLTTMVDIATILSFLVGPILGWLTLAAVTGPSMPAEYRPGLAMRLWCYLGLLLLGATAVIYGISRLGAWA
jgi:Mn2+/Fe2+ NRAMP family transporter